VDVIFADVIFHGLFGVQPAGLENGPSACTSFAGWNGVCFTGVKGIQVFASLNEL
jgi:hypothetical protein